VSFKNAAIVMTSNVGTGMIDKNTLGFSVHGKDSRTDDTRRRLLEELRKQFRPEFLNRVDDIIVFNSLTRENLRQIVDIQLHNVGKLLKDRKIKLEVHGGGQRPANCRRLRSAIRSAPHEAGHPAVDPGPLALKLINGEFKEGDTVAVDAKEGGSELQFSKLVPVSRGQGPGAGGRSEADPAPGLRPQTPGPGF